MIPHSNVNCLDRKHKPCRSSRLELFCKKTILRDFSKFTGICARVFFLIKACNFIKKETLAFSCEFCKISKNRFSYRIPSAAAISIHVNIYWLCDNNVCIMHTFSKEFEYAIIYHHIFVEILSFRLFYIEKKIHQILTWFRLEISSTERFYRLGCVKTSKR